MSPSPSPRQRFFQFALDRHEIYLKRSHGESPPWTEDPILRDNYFCNVYRRLDKTTIWYEENIAKPIYRWSASDLPRMVRATTIFRLLNRIETVDAVRDFVILGPGCEPMASFRKKLHAMGRPFLGGAYMIKTPAIMSKVDGLCRIIGASEKLWLPVSMAINYDYTIENAWRQLMCLPYIGGFMAYEIATDLTYTHLKDAPDRMMWAHAGPGAKRALCAMYGMRDMTGRECLQSMQSLLAESAIWAERGEGCRDWTMREVEHTLCEWGKYERIKMGSRAKRKYPTGGSI